MKKESGIQWYAMALKRPEWENKRKHLLSLKGHMCQNCKAQDTRLNVHHRHYRQSMQPWEYPDSDFEVLCESCHDIMHEGRRALTHAMSHAIGYLSIEDLRIVGFYNPSEILRMLRQTIEEEKKAMEGDE